MDINECEMIVEVKQEPLSNYEDISYQQETSVINVKIESDQWRNPVADEFNERQEQRASTDSSNSQTEAKIELEKCNENNINSEHQRKIAAYRQYQCEMCTKRFYKKKNLTQHFFKHANKLFSCCHCGKRYSEKRELIKHLMTETGERLFCCSVCRKVFQTQIGLLQHSQFHMDEQIFICLICDHRFKSRTAIVSHIRQHYAKRPFICHICKKSFTQKKSLSNHLLAHTGEKAFFCAECQKSFSNERLLQRHVLRHRNKKHKHLNNPQRKCSICSQNFSNKISLIKHLRLHTGIFPFTCHICNKDFDTKYSLFSHMPAHSDEQSLFCPQCGKNKSFGSRDLLREHIQRMHSDYVPLCCTFCDKTYKRETEFEEHVQSHQNAASMKFHTASHTEQDGPAEVEILYEYLQGNKTTAIETVQRFLKKSKPTNDQNISTAGDNPHIEQKKMESMSASSKGEPASQSELGKKVGKCFTTANCRHQCHICGLWFSIKYDVYKHLAIHL